MAASYMALTSSKYSSLRHYYRRDYQFLAILGGAAPRLRRGFGGQAPPFRIFAGGIPCLAGRQARRRRRRNAFGLIQEYCTSKDWVAPTSENSFGGGYNAIFLPNGWNKTLAEISPTEAMSWSYREQNFANVLNYILSLD